MWKAMSSGLTDAQYVAKRLESAAATLAALPNYGPFLGIKLRSLEIVNAAPTPDPDAPRRPPVPAPRAITQMDEALGWVIRYTTDDNPKVRKVLNMRLQVRLREDDTGQWIAKPLWSWNRIGKEVGASHEWCRQWHGKGVAMIADGIRRELREAA